MSGYKRHGKDTLVRGLITGRFDYPVAIFAHPDNPIRLHHQDGFRVALADEVKKDVKAQLNLSDDFDVEAQKEDIVADGKTFRHYCIKRAKEMRDQDIYWWSHLGFLSAKSRHAKGIPTISDNRNVDEITYARYVCRDVITIRMFRREVPIPPIDDLSEHGMDAYQTDFVAVPAINHPDQIEMVKELFPQYQDYVLISILE